VHKEREKKKNEGVALPPEGPAQVYAIHYSSSGGFIVALPGRVCCTIIFFPVTSWRASIGAYAGEWVKCWG